MNLKTNHSDKLNLVIYNKVNNELNNLIFNEVDSDISILLSSKNFSRSHFDKNLYYDVYSSVGRNIRGSIKQSNK